MLEQVLAWVSLQADPPIKIACLLNAQDDIEASNNRDTGLVQYASPSLSRRASGWAVFCYKASFEGYYRVIGVHTVIYIPTPFESFASPLTCCHIINLINTYSPTSNRDGKYNELRKLHCGCGCML